MIWFIIATIILFILVLTTVISTIMFNKYEKMEYNNKHYNFKKWNKWDDRKTFALRTLIIYILASAILVYIPIIIMHFTFLGEKNKVDLLERRKALIALIEKNEPFTIQNSLYENVVEYNQDVISIKHWANSSWTNWYYYDDYSDVTIIEI